MSLSNVKQILADMYAQGERDFRSFGGQLREADLSGLNLEESILSGLDLTGTDFTHANLRKVNLTGSKLKNADLACVQAERADMRFCFLANANLSSANLSDSRLEPSVFTEAIYNPKTQFPEGFDPIKKGLVRAAPVPRTSSVPSVASVPSVTANTDDTHSVLLDGELSKTEESVLSDLESKGADSPSAKSVGHEQPAPNASDEFPQKQSQQSKAAPPRRKISFRGRWVEI